MKHKHNLTADEVDEHHHSRQAEPVEERRSYGAKHHADQHTEPSVEEKVNDAGSKCLKEDDLSVLGGHSAMRYGKRAKVELRSELGLRLSHVLGLGLGSGMETGGNTNAFILRTGG